MDVIAPDRVAERIRPRDRDAVVQALRAGVVPRQGLRHVQVGRAGEVRQVIADMDRIGHGGAAIRFVIGEYGAGKTFFLTLARSVALERKLVTVHADLAPDRRLHATGGQARTLYAEMMRNMATRTRPDGGALPGVVERFVTESRKAAETRGRSAAAEIRDRLEPLLAQVRGHDFATVIERYHDAAESGDEPLKAAALRWLRGEYTLKTEARDALGVRTIIDDSSIYDDVRVMASFVRLAGYDGMLLVLDEMVNLYKLAHAQARASNYEQILRIVNDVLQGSCEHFGVYFGGTPEFLMDARRGLYSYEALRSRLAENSFAKAGFVDLSGPVLRLQSLTREEMLILLGNLRHLYAGGDPAAWLVPEAALLAFMDHCSRKIGDAYFRTPRNTIKGFLDLLAILDQNPGADWRALLDAVEIAPDVPQAGFDDTSEVADIDGEMAGFQL